MKYLGDIIKLDGTKIDPVSVITFGSPCQDLSVAGRRAGLQGERSSLFLDAVRIIKEMREATSGIYPAFAVWENVPGALSSNKGEDFRQVLQELARLCDDTISIPRPPKKWINAGSIMGDGYSIAWRILDSQYWGVPQRRRRIALVVDFGGSRAAEILFNPESLQRNPAPRGEAREAPAESAGYGAEIPGGALCRNYRAGEGTVGEACGVAGFNGYRGATASIEYAHERAPCITASMPPNVCAGFMAGQGAKAGGIGYSEELAPTLKGTASGLNQIPCVFDCRGNGDGEICPTITGDHQSRVTDYTAIVMSTGQAHAEILIDQGPTLNCNHEQPIIFGRFARRITPLECERLQGYPDGWTNILGAKDTPRYKALGNSISLPVFHYVLYHISRYLPPDATLGSLFDGIGGFPLIWERLHGRGTARWASEIESFPILVTTHHFPETAHPTTGDELCLHYAGPANMVEKSLDTVAEAGVKQL